MATLLEELKKRMFAAMKSGDVVEKEILRVAIGEIETAASRVETFDDEAARGVVRKLVKSNEETRVHAAGDAEKIAVLNREIDVLTGFLPKALGVDELVVLLAPVEAAVKAAANDGQATGVAMKHLKAQGVTAPGKDVGEAVKRLRS